MKELIIKGLQTSCKCAIATKQKFDECNLYKRTLKFLPGIIYGVQDGGDGGWALSYTISGNNKKYSGEIIYDNEIMTPKKLKDLVFYPGIAPVLGLGWNGYKKTGYEYLKRAYKETGLYEPDQVASLFCPEEMEGDRIYRKVENTSRGRWSVTLAIGYALGKKIYSFPWLENKHLSTLKPRLDIHLKTLKEDNCIIIIPSENPKDALGNLIDEVVEI